ncbi:MAG TPA: hypothetical protein VKA08_04700 [Balneolales bacterium]|nr:hypothetical protein [Balneolales bacterium]
MPTYVYKREDGTTFELMQGINDEPLQIDPETGQKVHRVITGGAGVVYKGTGWYVTDYKNKSNGSAGGSGSSAPKKSKTNQGKG